MNREKNKSSRPVRVGLISLGCAKNLVDAEIMLGSLLKDGMEITNDAAEADVMIVNTCSFIDAAQEESVDTILESAEVRQAQNRGQGLVVSGCLPQRFREDLPRLFPEVDAFMGIDQVARVGDVVREALERRLARLAGETRPKGRASQRSEVRGQRSGARGQMSSQARKSAIVDQFGKLQKPGETGEAVRGTERFGKTKTVVITSARPPAASSSDLGAAPVEVNQRPTYIPDYATPRFRLTPRHFAYLKIAEGCNHPCSFCIIPQMRGSHRSRTQADLVSEGRALLADGVKELNLISQDSTYYGLDLRPDHSRAISSPEKFRGAIRRLAPEATTISTLLRELNALRGDFWIRLLYTHPAHWTEELIQTIAECSKVARYVDIPLQHIHQNMLERMRRETSREFIVDLLRRIRAGIPGIALRTTFIVGFPGETEEYFQSLLEFIRAARFERLGIFTYSREEGTRAGGMSGQVPDRVKEKRRELAMAAQHEVAVQVAQAFVGRTLRALVERPATAAELKSARISSWEHGLIREGETPGIGTGTGPFLLARGEADAPDIDGRIYIRKGRRLPIGEFARVKIVAHTDYDLIAEPA